MFQIIDNTTIKIKRGDTAVFSIPNDIGEGIKYTAIFQVKRSLKDAECIMKQDVSDGNILFKSADTKGWNAGEYVYDIEYHLIDEEGDGQVSTFGPYKMIIDADVN